MRTELEAGILERVKPDLQERTRLRTLIRALSRKVKDKAQELGIRYEEVLVVGSIAKETNLAGTDLDLFVLFPPDTPRQEFEEQGLLLAKSVMDGEERFAEHPYLHGEVDGVEVDLVPSYKVLDPSKKLSAVDRTPFHTEFVRKNLSEKARDEVRLLKQFMKGIDVYGAEARVEGFSGYLTELLVIKYGSFREVLEAASGWERGLCLSLTGGSLKLDSALVFIDPTDAGRNVAAALSDESFGRFIHAASCYLAGPSEKFFFPEPVSTLGEKELRAAMDARGSFFAGLVFTHPDVVDDVFYPQVNKCVKTVMRDAQSLGFSPIHADYFEDDGKVLVVVELESGQLSTVKKHRGPWVWHDNSKDFLEKYRESVKVISGPYIQKGRWMVDLRRDEIWYVDTLKGRVPEMNLGKNINEEVAKGFEVLDPGSLMEHPMELSAFLDHNFPWER